MRLPLILLLSLVGILPASSRQFDAILELTVPFTLTERGVQMEPRLIHKPKTPRETKTQPVFRPWSEDRRRH